MPIVVITVSFMIALRKMPSLSLLLVVLVCDQALAAFSATDEPVAVTVERKELSASRIASCLTSKTTYNVRINSIQSNMTNFNRLLVNMSTIESYVSKFGNGTAQHIGDCAQMADEGGFDGFAYIDGLCKMFSLNNFPCRCEVGTGDLIYVQDSFWGKTGIIKNRLVPAAGELMENVRWPSIVIDQQTALGISIFFAAEVLNPTDDQLMTTLLTRSPGLTIFMCSGNKCRSTTDVDTAHCSMSCNSSSNWVVHRQFTYQQKVIDEISPRKYFLSECGNTITANWTFPEGETQKSLYVMSHEGFGCKWYPKAAGDLECAVTFRALSTISIQIYQKGLDGNTSTCEGDTIKFYHGAPTNGVLNKDISSCDNGKMATVSYTTPGDAVVVFKRSARQYRSDGFNYGFFFQAFY